MKDALQVTFTRVVKHVRVFSDEPTLWSWLTVLARSAAYDESRKRRRYLAFLDRFQRQVEVNGFVSADRQDSDQLDRLLEKSMTLLFPEERELLEMKYFARCSVREIAAQLQLSEKAVESRLTRARQNLREIIQKGSNDEI